MNYMFLDCDNFNQPLNNWDVSNVESMQSMFARCVKFNQPLDNWNTKNLKNCTNMFAWCYKFDQPLHLWNIKKVKTLNWMFRWCVSYSYPTYKCIQSNNIQINDVISFPDNYDSGRDKIILNIIHNAPVSKDNNFTWIYAYIDDQYMNNNDFYKIYWNKFKSNKTGKSLYFWNKLQTLFTSL